MKDMFIWLNDPLNWTNPGGILDRLWQHIYLTVGAVLLACLIAWPLGLWLGQGSAKRGQIIVVASNITLALPTLALLTVLPLTFIGFGPLAVIIALAVFAIPPLLATAYTGMRSVDPEVRDAAQGLGLSKFQRGVRVELPLAVPSLFAGFRTAVVQVIATATLAALVDGGGLGVIINEGLGLQNFGQVMAGAFLVTSLCLLVEALLAFGQRRLARA
jgi:osmoprotectant transport system permease protein